MQHFVGGLTTIPQNPPRCECHECTQARWKMSFQGQMDASLQAKKQQSIPNGQIQTTPFPNVEKGAL